MIRKPTDIIDSKNHFLIIAGVPGIGKTTLGLSAPDPLLINIDENYRKVNPSHMVADHISPENYQELVNDLRTADLSPYKTIVFDTGGALVSLMSPYVIGLNKSNGQRDGVTLSMKGYGAIKSEFEALINMCIKGLKKNIVMIFHMVEKKENEQIVYRLDISGSSGRFAWKKAQLGGTMFIENGERVIDFSPTESYHAKGAYGITGKRLIPKTSTSETNTFISDIFREANKSLEKEKELIAEYKNLMDEIRGLIDGIDSVETANDVFSTFPGVKWIYAAKREAWALLQKKAAEKSLKFNPETKSFEGVECGTL